MAPSTSDIISCFESEQRATVFSSLSEYLSTGQYVDISLVCKGQVLRAHKVVLSSSSKYFKDYFRHQPGVNIIDLDKELAPNDLSLTLEDVQLIIGILYCVGTVEISPARIETLLICAQVLGIPTLISFLKKIRDSINDGGKILKDAPPPRLEYNQAPMISPAHHKLLAAPSSSTVSRSFSQRRSSGAATDMMFLIPPSGSHQFPAQPPPPSAPVLFSNQAVMTPRHPSSSSTFTPITTRPTFTRAADTPSPRSPLLDLSVVKPMTASCVNSPVNSPQQPQDQCSLPSPTPGPSGLQQQHQERPRSVGFPTPGPSGVQDSMLSANMTKIDPETAAYRRNSSRISSASYSSFTLNYLQSPRLKSTDNPSTDNPQTFDGFDQNFFMSLNNLQANQIDDLLLPHLDGRADNQLLDLNNIDDVEDNPGEDNDISTTTTTPEEETDPQQLPPTPSDSQEPKSLDQSHDDAHDAIDFDDIGEEPSPSNNISLDKSETEPSKESNSCSTQSKLKETSEQQETTPSREEPVGTPTREGEEPVATPTRDEPENKRMKPSTSQDSMTSSILYGKSVTMTPRPVTPVRMTPNTSNSDLTATPIRLTPSGIALTPIKNLIATEEAAAPAEDVNDQHNESLDETDGGGQGEQQQSSEIIMNLDKVIEGQKMKFSIPGISQAVTVNFSPEALQEMKNAALSVQNNPGEVAAAEVLSENNTSTAPSDNPNQNSEITSSEKTKDSEQYSSNNNNKMSKKKNNRKNLRQKLKSNLRSPLKVAKDEENFPKPLNYLCPICNKTFPSVAQLEKHQKFHVQKCFTCKECHEIFEKKWLYDQHISEKHGHQVDTFVCPECKKEFSQRNLLLAHIQSQHKKETQFKCFICNLNFNKKHNLMTHLSSWHPNEKFPYCPVCMEIFSDNRSFENHDCPGAEIKNREVICHLHDSPVRFTNRVELDRHMKEKHGTTEESFNISCCICQKKFLLRNNLLKHLRNVHNQGDGEKHICPTCGKQFYYKDDLKNHLQIHIGDLKFKCSEENCDKAYSTLKALKKHKKLTHELDIESVTCKVCNKQLSTKFKLKAHMLVHSNAKPFSCTHCSETFKEKRNVVKHIKLKHIRPKVLKPINDAKSAAAAAAASVALSNSQTGEESSSHPGENVQTPERICNNELINNDQSQENEEQPDSTDQME